MADNELDVRQLRKPDKHPTIFAAYAGLSVGESFVLVNNHDPKHLHDEFEAHHAGSYGWEYLEKGPAVWKSATVTWTRTSSRWHPTAGSTHTPTPPSTS
jgi:uncharacterized protein (DUF2249 family)